MARTTVPLMLEAVKGKHYQVISSTEDGLEGKVIISISFEIQGETYLLTRSIQDRSPLQFRSSASLELVGKNGNIFLENLRYRGDELCAEIVFETVKGKKPEYLW